MLDTNVISEMMRQAPDARVERWIDAIPKAELAAASVSAFEIIHGVDVMPPSRSRSRLLALAEDVFSPAGGWTILDFDLAAARLASSFRARRKALGRPVTVPDAMIAGIALRHRAALATRNTRDFQEAGLSLIDPWNADR